MRVPFESGGRQRPVDVSVDDSEDLPLDGTRLKQERIERGISVNDAAHMATLSREQIEQIEGGGLRAFYGARHKRLAAKKYADVFGIDFSELLPPEPVVSETQGVVTEPIQSIVSSAPAPVAESRGVMAQASGRSNFESRRLPLIVVIVVALVLTFSILRGLTPTPKPVTEPILEPVSESAAPVEAVPAVPDQAAPASATASVPASTTATTPAPPPAPTVTSTASATDAATATPAAPATTPEPAKTDAEQQEAVNILAVKKWLDFLKLKQKKGPLSLTKNAISPLASMIKKLSPEDAELAKKLAIRQINNITIELADESDTEQ